MHGENTLGSHGLHSASACVYSGRAAVRTLVALAVAGVSILVGGSASATLSRCCGEGCSSSPPQQGCVGVAAPPVIQSGQISLPFYYLPPEERQLSQGEGGQIESCWVHSDKGTQSVQFATDPKGVDVVFVLQRSSAANPEQGPRPKALLEIMQAAAKELSDKLSGKDVRAQIVTYSGSIVEPKLPADLLQLNSAEFTAAVSRLAMVKENLDAQALSEAILEGLYLLQSGDTREPAKAAANRRKLLVVVSNGEFSNRAYGAVAQELGRAASLAGVRIDTILYGGNQQSKLDDMRSLAVSSNGVARIASAPRDLKDAILELQFEIGRSYLAQFPVPATLSEGPLRTERLSLALRSSEGSIGEASFPLSVPIGGPGKAALAPSGWRWDALVVLLMSGLMAAGLWRYRPDWPRTLRLAPPPRTPASPPEPNDHIAHVTVSRPGGSSQVERVGRGLLIGDKPECDVYVSGMGNGPFACAIIYREGGYYLRGSPKVEVTVMDRPIQREATLEDKDYFMIAGTRFDFRITMTTVSASDEMLPTENGVTHAQAADS